MFIGKQRHKIFKGALYLTNNETYLKIIDIEEKTFTFSGWGYENYTIIMTPGEWIWANENIIEISFKKYSKICE